MIIDIPAKKPLAIEFKTQALPGTGLNIDREGRTIADVLLIRVGEADGHGFSVEASFIEAMNKYIRKSMGGRVQCNMGHRWDANFFQLGKFTGLKIAGEGKELRGTLTVYEAADKSPALAGMADWFLDLAEEDHEAVMCSIKFEAAGYYQYDEKGNKVYVQSNWYSGPVKQFKDKPVFVEFGRLFSCDIVDQGALTDSLFSADGPTSGGKRFAEIVNAPDFIQFLRDHEDHFPQLQAFYEDKFKFSLPKFLSGIFSNQNNNMEPGKETSIQAATAAANTPTPPAAEQAAASASPELSAMQNQFNKLQEQFNTLSSNLTEKDKRIAELEKKPMAKVTDIESSDPAVVTPESGTELFNRNPINERARKIVASHGPVKA